MSDNWIDKELETANLEDKRLNDRFAQVLKALGDRPNFSIPAACGGHTETMAAYRFFENDKVDFDKILKPHRDATEKRISEQEIVLCVQDTSEIDLTRPQQQIRGAGQIGSGSRRRGAYLHLLEAFVPDGTPLGAVWAKTFLRSTEETRTPEETIAKSKRRASMAIEEKESLRWLEDYRETIKLADRNEKTTCICTLPIGTWKQVLAVIEYYECRWMIEVFFKTLKSGCKVESLQFEEMSRLLPCLGVYMIVAWRVLMICRLGRSVPEMSCEAIFEEAEWKSTCRVMSPKKSLPKKAPTMDVMIRMIGELGGWVSTPGKTELPGPQTTWIGLQRVQDFARSWKTFGPDAQKSQKNV